jgi:peptidoglycan DL-endopeptidase CwlO
LPFRPISTASWNNRLGITSAAIAAGAAVLFGAASAAAEPSVREQRAQAEAVLAEVQTLDEQVGAAAERFNGANYKLGLLAERLRRTRADLKRTRRDFGTAQTRASDRLVELYVNGSGMSALEIAFGSASFGELMDALETRRRVAAQDARLIGDLGRLADRTKAREQQLTAAQSKQRELVGRLAAERDAIGQKLAERQRLLGSIQQEVERLEAEEQARQAELRRRARAELARQRELAAAQVAREQENAARAVPEPEAVPPAPAAAEPSETAPPAPPADASRGAQVVAIAMRYLGVPYKWGGASPSTGFDCSGFTMYVFAQIGVSLPHYAAAQYQLGRPVSKSALAPGDLVFFRGLGHMGMYIGGGNFIHSPRTGDVVKISSLSEPYRVANWVGARRVL